MNRIFLTMLLTILLTAGCRSIPEEDNGSNQTKSPEKVEDSRITPKDPKENLVEIPKDPIKEQIDNMTIEEKIGQMVLVGINEYIVDDTFKELIERYHVGGIIFFERNINNSNQLLSLVNSIKNLNNANKIPLFISIDEEGGRVSRVPKELKKLPTNKAIGRIANKNASFEIGTILAKEIKAYGFNMNFAPVLDVNSNPQNPVIGDRSFSSNYDVVSDLGIQTMKGIQSEGVISVVKHFPGHGDTSVDSHIGLPIVNKTTEELMSLELIPFKDAISNDADMVMIAHILLPKIDDKNPASMSKALITNILREDMGFDGVVITDDMTMGAITENYDIGSAAIESILAGADIVMVAHNYEMQKSVIDAIKEAVISETILEERIDESVYRILTLKKSYAINNEVIESIDIETINNEIEDIKKRYFK